eukprot:SAG31_NODE_12839_length_913_cov_0.998771_1_plen_194_part_00
MLWNRYGKKVGQLGPHNASVAAVCVNDTASQLISMGTDDLCKVWDLSNNHCTQTIDASFVPGTVSVHGDRKTNLQTEIAASPGAAPVVNKKTFLFDQESQAILLGTHPLSVWQTKAVAAKQKVASHSAPVMLALYNAQTHQVVSADEAGRISAWDFDCGTQTYSLEKPHGGHKVNSSTFAVPRVRSPVPLHMS